MIYNNRNIYEEAPEIADHYRKAYIDGIENFVKTMNQQGKAIRRDFMPPEELVKDSEKYRKLYYDMLGLNNIDTSDCPPVKKEYVASDDACDIFRLTVYITKEIPFYAMLLLPKGATKVPLVITQHGGGGTPELCLDIYGKNNYNHMAQRVIDRGAAVLAPQLLLWSTNEIETQRKHDIPYSRGKVDTNLRRFGLSITALEIKGIMKALDYACSLDEIDRENISMMGLSYGGYFTLHTMAADTRIKSAYTAGCFNDRDKHDFSDWCYHNSGLTFQDAEVAALCAPRRLYIQVGKADGVFDYKTAIPEMERVKAYYHAFGKDKNLKTNVWEGGHTVSCDDEGYDFIFSV